MKVKELVKLLQRTNLEAEVFIAPTPFRTGYVNMPLRKLGRVNGTAEVVIGCIEETAYESELNIKWPRGTVMPKNVHSAWIIQAIQGDKTWYWQAWSSEHL